MSDHDWNVKCKAAFLALYGALRLCRDIGIDVETMLFMLRDKLRDDGCLLPDGRIVVKPNERQPRPSPSPASGGPSNDEA